MRTFLAALSGSWQIIKWLHQVYKHGKARLSVQQAKEDRLAWERIFANMAKENVAALPRSLRWLCGVLKRLGLLDDLGRYGQAFLKSEKIAKDDPVLYRSH